MALRFLRMQVAGGTFVVTGPPNCSLRIQVRLSGGRSGGGKVCGAGPEFVCPNFPVPLALPVSAAALYVYRALAEPTAHEVRYRCAPRYCIIT